MSVRRDSVISSFKLLSIWSRIKQTAPPTVSFRLLSPHQVLESLSRLVKALSILEKYGCNLTSPTRPRYWRSVKHNNPVFRTTVDAIKGGRRVLYLYGYTNQQVDGLSFPDDVTEPDTEKVAAVTLEVMTLRSEVDMIVKNKPVGDSLVVLPKEEQQVEKPPIFLVFSSFSASPAADQCNLCGGASSLLCPSCDSQPFCDACDDRYHRHPSRASHKRDKIQKTKQGATRYDGKTTNVQACLLANCRCRCVFAETCSICGTAVVHAHCSTCIQRLCLNCDRLFHSHPDRKGHNRTTVTPWQCKSCTVVNQGSSILCEVCERPRLATRPPVAPVLSDSGTKVCLTYEVSCSSHWTCQFCTYVNSKPSAACEMCSLSCKDSAGVSLPQSLQQTPSSIKNPPQPSLKPQAKPRVNVELKRQNTMREDGLALVHQIREAEKRDVSPEEVYAALCVCGGSNVNPCDWLTSELPHLLEEICAMAKQSGQNAAGDGMKLSRAEAKLAWLAAGGDTDRAVRQLLRDRQVKMRELHSLGFRNVSQCEEALRQSGGEVKGALSLLQRPVLEPFHQRIWADQPEPPIDPKHPDKQRMCRRLLALYDLPSWGRCELVLSLLQEPDVTYSLEDVVQAVKESHDKDFIRRLLNNECPCCLGIFPRGKMQSLTSCQCSVCHDCFRQHFTIAVRDKHIRDMVCPVCSEPDINDPEQLDSYFSTLDIQLRDCLEGDVYALFHQKLTEHMHLRVYQRRRQLKVTCPSCRKSFCAQCKKPWEPQHQDVTCEQFQQWKRENDPEDNGITCPHCRFQYALTKGGCMHFSCSQCRYQFCSGCNNPYHKVNVCKTPQCSYHGLHAHHPRDCLFYLRDWEPNRLQALLQVNHNILFVSLKARGGVSESYRSPGACGIQTQPGQAGLCEKHYREYLVSLINAHSLDPALLYEPHELIRACERYLVDKQRADNEEDNVYHARLLKVEH
uniref:Uncharacterized protein n=1 Tax=Amphiprion percula TaxID=161767 RepID=A0A3P8SIA2_AMPPE